MNWIDKWRGKETPKEAPSLESEPYLELSAMNLQDLHAHLQGRGRTFAGKEEMDWIADGRNLHTTNSKAFQNNVVYYFLGSSGYSGHTLRWDFNETKFIKKTVHFNAAMGAIPTWGSDSEKRRLVFKR